CILFFFFSSRRRHTRSKRDWSSDVCSSDLVPTRSEIAEAATADEMAARTADRAEQVLGAIHAALRAEPGSAGTHLTIRYSSADRAGTSVRRIRPLSIETDGARSYLLADCELAEGRRRFRLDRIVELLSDGTPMSR